MNEQENATMETESRLDRLLLLLSSDAENPALLGDAADAAVEERRPEEAIALLERLEAIVPLPPREANLMGLAAMQLGRHDRAEAAFERLVAGGSADATVRANHAWAKAMQKDLDGALALLDDPLAFERPEAAMLKVQILHEQGEFEEAARLARIYVERHPDHRGLLAAASVLALDVEDAELAARCAAAAGDHPAALATLGTLALGEDRATEALAMFDRALERDSGAPRAWVGRGLAKLLSGDSESASEDIDKGAELFGDHLGSWIAAGWACFINRDLAAARVRFEKALALDSTFAESHGSLAVLDLLEGRREQARKGCDVALRLDRESFSGALARVLLAADAGDQAGARRIFDAALTTPIGRNGRTIAQALVRIGL